MIDEDIRELIDPFAAEAEEAFLALESALVEIESRGGDVVPAAELRPHLAAMHTVKGNAGMLGMPLLSGAVHQLEEVVKRNRSLDGSALKGLLRMVDDVRDDLARIRDGAEDAVATAVWTEWLQQLADGEAADSGAGSAAFADSGQIEGSRAARSLRVSVEKLDDLQQEVGELILSYNALVETLRSRVVEGLDRDTQRETQDALDRLSRRVRHVQSATTRTRLLGLATILRRVPRIVRDAAERTGKTVQVDVIGDGVEADKGVIDELAEVIVHLVRNAVDHGIEPPAARAAAGKPQQGRLTVRAESRGELVVIEVADDGGGIDVARVRRKAAERGVVSEAEAAVADEEAVLRWLFAAGFSTRDEATELSGRGVGLDVVDRTVRGLGGAVRVEHEAGRGTRFTLTVPVSTAVAELMEIDIADRRLFVPLGRIVATERYNEALHETPGGTDRYRFRGELVPLLPLAEQLAPEAAAGPYVLVLEHAAGRVALRVQTIVGKGQAVLAPLGDPLLQHGPFAGGTVRGNGHVGLILDPDRLVAWQRGRAA
jgi:two-component system chemotaxis sensor kinase CheA